MATERTKGARMRKGSSVRLRNADSKHVVAGRIGTTESGGEAGGHRSCARLALVAGTLSALMVVATLWPVPAIPPSPAGQIAFYAQHTTAAVLLVAGVLVWAVGSVPFTIAVGRFLAPGQETAALTGSALSVVGILLLGFAVFAHVAALLAVATTSPPPLPDLPVYEARIWIHLSSYLTDPPLAMWGLGQLLLAWLAWRSARLPDWLALVGAASGMAGLVALAAYPTGLPALLQLAAFSVWGLGTGATLLRSTRGT